MELDHLFLFVSDIAEAEALGASIGLVETYRRRHPGQGTENICYCFDNAFIELLVVTDEAECRSPLISRTGLYERAQYRLLETCPVGISWRLKTERETEPFETWSFTPPYLPNGMDIRVAVGEDDPRQPMMFRSPGTTPPAKSGSDQRGDLQRASGLTDISKFVLTYPDRFRPSDCLATLVEHLPVQLEKGMSSEWRLTVVAKTQDGQDRDLVLL